MVDAAAPEPVRDLPAGYPVYCIFFPSGWASDAESKVLQALKQWGTSMGENLYVASWDVGSRAYVEISNGIGLTRVPAVVLTDASHPDAGSFMIKLDDAGTVNDLDKLRPLLTLILQRLLLGEKAGLLKELMKARDKNRVRDLVENALHDLSFKATINLGVFSVEIAK